MRRRLADAVWRDAVAPHHEQVDGKGYPQGIASEVLPRKTQAAGLAENYRAMVIERGYRLGIT